MNKLMRPAKSVKSVKSGMHSKHVQRLRWLGPTLALIAVLCFSTSALASPRSVADRGGGLLTPDPVAYCITNPPEQLLLQREVDDGAIYFDHLAGDSYQNNWGCDYVVALDMPIPFTDCGDGPCMFTPLPTSYTMPIDWNAICNQQYPGAIATWITGPETGVYGTPWGCVGAPGILYDPAEQADGTHLVVSGG